MVSATLSFLSFKSSAGMVYFVLAGLNGRGCFLVAAW